MDSSESGHRPIVPKSKDESASQGIEQDKSKSNINQETTTTSIASTATSKTTTSAGSSRQTSETTKKSTTTLTTTKTTPATLATTSNTATKEENEFIDSLIDDVIFCECLQVHRAAKMGYIFTEPNDEMYRIKEGDGYDVFGQPLIRPKKQLNCTCPQCGRNIGASRLAPHLEKCMGMGRLSARAASNKRDTT